MYVIFFFTNIVFCKDNFIIIKCKIFLLKNVMSALHFIHCIILYVCYSIADP
ncbi:unknown [Prevotella sp. CAG:487]|nr:unknown [Prevotella sp. CAG:487]